MDNSKVNLRRNLIDLASDAAMWLLAIVLVVGSGLVIAALLACVLQAVHG